MSPCHSCDLAHFGGIFYSLTRSEQSRRVFFLPKELKMHDPVDIALNRRLASEEAEDARLSACEKEYERLFPFYGGGIDTELLEKVFPCFTEDEIESLHEASIGLGKPSNHNTKDAMARSLFMNALEEAMRRVAWEIAEKKVEERK
jgi:hypothetical protein